MTPKTPPGGWWRGSGPPGDAGARRFTAALASAECKGCLFERNNAATCRQAGEIAAAMGLPDCEERADHARLTFEPGIGGSKVNLQSASPNRKEHAPAGQAYIYVQDKSDPRQVDMIKVLKSTESEK